MYQSEKSQFTDNYSYQIISDQCYIPSAQKKQTFCKSFFLYETLKVSQKMQKQEKVKIENKALTIDLEPTF